MAAESSPSGDPTPWSIEGGKQLDEWLFGLDVLFLSEVINKKMVDKIVRHIHVIYIPNLEWTVLKGEEGKVAAWIKLVIKYVNKGMTVLAKTQTATEVLLEHDIDCSIIDWSVPDAIRTKKRSTRRKKIRVLMNAGLGGWRSRRGVDIMMQAIKSMPAGLSYKFILKTIKPWAEYELGDVPLNVELVEGFVSRQEMDDLVESADLIIYPSRFEGFGLSQLEALHKGIPVMCTNGWPMNELQTVDDKRLLIDVKQASPLRLAWSFEADPDSIVENLVAMNGQHPCNLFPIIEVTKGLEQRQERFRVQIHTLVQDLINGGVQ